MVFQDKHGADVEKTVTDTQFRIATNSKLFSILSDSIYTRKIDAVIRELCCNAFDAHVEARQSRKFQVTLPSEFNSEFRVRDFGLGLCEEDMQMYTTYGESTKSSSNAYIGAFGIGAKSPFAYTGIFNVTSYHDGQARAYSMFVEDGVPRMTKLGEGPSEEPPGLEVFFPVRPGDIDEFKDKVISICALMAERIEFLQADDRWLAKFDLEVNKYKWSIADYLGPGYATCDLKVDIDYNYDYLYIIQGNVRYEMHSLEVINMLQYTIGREYDKMVSRVKAQFCITGFLKVPNGTFVPHPSRERFTFDEITKSTIKSIFGKIYRYYVEDAVDRVLDGVKSYYDLHRRIYNISPLVSSNSKIIEFYNGEQDILPGVNRIRDYEEWRNFNFSCVQIVGLNAGGYRFKNVPQLSMYGNRIDRIYYTRKYPLSGDYRYRVLKDNIQSGAKNSIILFGDISKVFTEDDKAAFVNVQSLPKIAPQDLSTFKKGIDSAIRPNVRVAREEVSFLEIMRRSTTGKAYELLYQRTPESILDMSANFPVYWVGSNKRYEFQLGNRYFHLKVQKDMANLNCQYFAFFIDYIESNVSGKPSQFGVVVLPLGHSLRNMLPELKNALVDGLRFVATDFMNRIFYKISSIQNNDVLFLRLVKNHELLMRIFAEDCGVAGNIFKEFFSGWISSGMPEFVQKIEQPSLPFEILSDGEKTLLQDDYYSGRNIKELDVPRLYDYLGDHGFPLVRRFLWGRVGTNAEADDLIDYIINKADRLFNDRN
jgi:hypothetical protein